MGDWTELSEGLRRDVHDILQAMEEAGQGQPWLALPKPYNLNNLRDLIVHLGEAAWGENPDTAYSRLVWTAASHGEHRMQSGYAESLLFTEYHLLREVIWSYLEQHREDRAGIQAIRRLDSAITDATSASLFGYHRAILEAKGLWPGAIEGLIARGRGRGG